MWNESNDNISFTNIPEVKTDDKEEVRLLIESAQKGNQRSFAKLLEIYEPLISSMVYKFKIDGVSDSDSEDLRQEAILAFYSALVSYDSEISEVEFGLYAKVCICNRLVSQIRILKRHLDHNVDLADPDEFLSMLAEYDDPAQKIVEFQKERSLLKLINDNLSRYEQKVFRMYASAMSASQMAERLGCSEKSVSNAVYRIRRKLKNLLKSDK